MGVVVQPLALPSLCSQPVSLAAPCAGAAFIMAAATAITSISFLKEPPLTNYKL